MKAESALDRNGNGKNQPWSGCEPRRAQRSGLRDIGAELMVIIGIQPGCARAGIEAALMYLPVLLLFIRGSATAPAMERRK